MENMAAPGVQGRAVMLDRRAGPACQQRIKRPMRVVAGRVLLEIRAPLGDLPPTGIATRNNAVLHLRLAGQRTRPSSVSVLIAARRQ